MQSRDKGYNVNKLVTMSIMVGIALVLSYFERFIPLSFIFPGLKLGLANVVILMAILYFGVHESALIVLIRVIMTGFFTGSMISFFFSLSGSVLSFAVMVFTVTYFKKWFSLVGISVIGAVGHNTGQIIAMMIVLGNIGIGMRWYPFLILAGVATGLVTGLVALYFNNHYLKMKI